MTKYLNCIFNFIFKNKRIIFPHFIVMPVYSSRCRTKSKHRTTINCRSWSTMVVKEYPYVLLQWGCLLWPVLTIVTINLLLIDQSWPIGNNYNNNNNSLYWKIQLNRLRFFFNLSPSPICLFLYSFQSQNKSNPIRTMY